MGLLNGGVELLNGMTNLRQGPENVCHLRLYHNVPEVHSLEHVPYIISTAGDISDIKRVKNLRDLS